MTQPKTGIYSLISLDILDEFSQSFHHINAPYVQMMDLYFITMCILCTFASFLLLARGRHCGTKPAIRYALPRISSFLFSLFFYYEQSYLSIYVIDFHDILTKWKVFA